MTKKTKLIVGTITAAAISIAAIFFALSGAHGAFSDARVYVQPLNTLMGNPSWVQNRYMGVVESQETWDVNLIDNQTVKEIFVKVGDEVSEGSVLFEYDQNDINLKISQAKLELEEIGNEIQGYQTQINELNAEKANASQDEQFNYTVQIQSLQTSIKQSEYNQKAKKLELEKLQSQLTESKVVSKINGVVKEINENGATDSMGNQKPFMSVLTTGDYRVKGIVNESNVWMLEAGSSVIIRSRVNDTKTWQGTIESVDTENKVNSESNSSTDSDINTSSTKYPFYVNLDNADGLMLGQHLYIEIDNGQNEKTEGLFLYSSYVVTGDTNYVWIDDGKGRLKKQSVELGEYNEELDRYEILTGLDAKDLVAWPYENLKLGMKTTRVETEATNFEDTSQDKDAEPSDSTKESVIDNNTEK